MKVALDATYSVGEDLSGVGVYSREILHGLARQHPDARFYWCYRPHRLLRAFQESVPRPCRRRPLAEQYVPACDVYHALNQRMPRRRPRRSACTFHDLFVLTGDYSTPEFRRRFARQAREAADRADLLIAVSEFTASQVRDLLNVEAGRIRVVRHGVRFPPAPPPAERERIVLHVGALQRRKNLGRLVEAFERLPQGWRLVLAGSSGYGAGEILDRVAVSPRRAEIEVRGYVSDAELATLYARAGVFAFPSLDEGFGMPVLEAMAWGVPVVASNRSALPEVSGDAALLVNPEEVDAIAAAMRTLIEDARRREEMARRGRDRAAEFRWKDAVGKTWLVYQELTGGR